MQIFNRRRGRKHPLFAVLQQMQERDGSLKAKASNLKHDARVSHEREGKFLSFIGKCKSAGEFEDHRKKFLEQRIKFTTAPEFKRKNNNANKASPEETLVCIFVLNGLERMFEWARKEAWRRYSTAGISVEDFKTFENYPTQAGPGEKLTEKRANFITRLMAPGAGRIAFLQAVFRLYDQYKNIQPYHPMWLTKSKDFQAVYRSKDADRWCHFVGVPTAKKANQWVVALEFKPAELGQLYSPTVLDCNSHFFFSTPDGCPANSGLAMDLAMLAVVPACEYIVMHPSLNLAQVDYEDGCQQLREQTVDDIQSMRGYHIDRLRHAFKAKRAVAWLNRVQAD
jgi:hypothetical protein